MDFAKDFGMLCELSLCHICPEKLVLGCHKCHTFSAGISETALSFPPVLGLSSLVESSCSRCFRAVISCVISRKTVAGFEIGFVLALFFWGLKVVHFHNPL